MMADSQAVNSQPSLLPAIIVAGTILWFRSENSLIGLLGLSMFASGLVWVDESVGSFGRARQLAQSWASCRPSEIFGSPIAWQPQYSQVALLVMWGSLILTRLVPPPFIAPYWVAKAFWSTVRACLAANQLLTGRSKIWLWTLAPVLFLPAWVILFFWTILWQLLQYPVWLWSVFHESRTQPAVKFDPRSQEPPFWPPPPGWQPPSGRRNLSRGAHLGESQQSGV